MLPNETSKDLHDQSMVLLRIPHDALKGKHTTKPLSNILRPQQFNRFYISIRHLPFAS